METNIKEIVLKYIKDITFDEYHRYKSWDNCFKAFSMPNKSEVHVLELAFYLASWGMYRGSSGLLQKNHLIHRGAVDIVFSTKNQEIKCNEYIEVKRDDIQRLLSIKKELAKHYSKIYFTKGTNKSKYISPTDTLLSKIMLGTLGCVPAYDRYFIDGMKEMKMKHTRFSESSLNELFNFIEENKIEISQVQEFIKNETNQHYPKMKIVDMYFWQIGYNKEIKKKTKEGK